MRNFLGAVYQDFSWETNFPFQKSKRIFRSSQVLYKKDFLKILQNSLKNICAIVYFSKSSELKPACFQDFSERITSGQLLLNLSQLLIRIGLYLEYAQIIYGMIPYQLVGLVALITSQQQTNMFKKGFHLWSFSEKFLNFFSIVFLQNISQRLEKIDT